MLLSLQNALVSLCIITTLTSCQEFDVPSPTQGHEATVVRRAAVNERLRLYAAKATEMLAQDDALVLTEEDLDLLDSVGLFDGIYPESNGLGLMAATLRLGEALGNDDFESVVSFATTEPGQTVSLPLLYMCMHFGHADRAAEIAIDSLETVPPDNRSYQMWKWWETVWMCHPSQHTKERDFILALLDQFEQGPNTQGPVIQDLFSGTPLTVEGLPKLRENVIASAIAKKEYFDKEVRAMAAGGGDVWIDDRKGLRKITRLEFFALRRPTWTFQCRLVSNEEVWGTLVADEDLLEGILARLSRFAEITGAQQAEWQAPKGVIITIPNEHDSGYSLDYRMNKIGEEVARLLESCDALLAEDHKHNRSPGRAKRIITEALAVTREAARHTALAKSVRPSSSAHGSGSDDIVLARLRTLNERVADLLPKADTTPVKRSGSNVEDFDQTGGFDVPMRKRPAKKGQGN